MLKPVEETKEEKEVEPEHIIIKEDSMKKSMPPPFPQALKGKKKGSNQTEILEVLRQVKVNIPLIDMIKQVPTYAKFLKDLGTVKRRLNVDKKTFLTEQVNAIIQSKTPVKYKDLGLLDRIRVCAQIYNIITKRLLSNPRQRRHKTC